MKCVRTSYNTGWSFDKTDIDMIKRVDEAQKVHTCCKCESQISIGSPYIAHTYRKWINKNATKKRSKGYLGWIQKKYCIRCGLTHFEESILYNKKGNKYV